MKQLRMEGNPRGKSLDLQTAHDLFVVAVVSNPYFARPDKDGLDYGALFNGVPAPEIPHQVIRGLIFCCS